jgi:hypothetical protein
MALKLLSSMPSGVEIDLSAPDGIRIISWSTHENKYTFEVWAKGKTGPYQVWTRKVLRAHYAGGPGRPRWSRLGEPRPTFQEALEAAIEAREGCLWGGKPREFVIRYLHEALEKLVTRKGR